MMDNPRVGAMHSVHTLLQGTATTVERTCTQCKWQWCLEKTTPVLPSINDEGPMQVLCKLTVLQCASSAVLALLHTGSSTDTH
jgi:hypothetical protein